MSINTVSYNGENPVSLTSPKVLGEPLAGDITLLSDIALTPNRQLSVKDECMAFYPACAFFMF